MRIWINPRLVDPATLPTWLRRRTTSQPPIGSGAPVSQEERERELRQLVDGLDVPVGDGAITARTVAEVTHVLGRARRIARTIGIALALAMVGYVVVQLVLTR